MFDKRILIAVALLIIAFIAYQKYFKKALGKKVVFKEPPVAPPVAPAPSVPIEPSGSS